MSSRLSKAFVPNTRWHWSCLLSFVEVFFFITHISLSLSLSLSLLLCNAGTHNVKRAEHEFVCGDVFFPVSQSCNANISLHCHKLHNPPKQRCNIFLRCYALSSSHLFIFAVFFGGHWLSPIFLSFASAFFVLNCSLSLLYLSLPPDLCHIIFTKNTSSIDFYNGFLSTVLAGILVSLYLSMTAVGLAAGHWGLNERRKSFCLQGSISFCLGRKIVMFGRKEWSPAERPVSVFCFFFFFFFLFFQSSKHFILFSSLRKVRIADQSGKLLGQHVSFTKSAAHPSKSRRRACSWRWATLPPKSRHNKSPGLSTFSIEHAELHAASNDSRRSKEDDPSIIACRFNVVCVFTESARGIGSGLQAYALSQLLQESNAQSFLVDLRTSLWLESWHYPPGSRLLRPAAVRLSHRSSVREPGRFQMDHDNRRDWRSYPLSLSLLIDQSHPLMSWKCASKLNRKCEPLQVCSVLQVMMCRSDNGTSLPPWSGYFFL